jgi:hypothetical protein
VVRFPGYRTRGPCSIPRRYQIFWEVVGLERDPLSLVSGSDLEAGNKAVGIRCADHLGLCPQKLAWNRSITEIISFPSSASHIKFLHQVRTPDNALSCRKVLLSCLLQWDYRLSSWQRIYCWVFLGRKTECVSSRERERFTTPWPLPASELYRPSDRPFVGEVSANSFEDRGCHVVCVTDPYGRILGF